MLTVKKILAGRGAVDYYLHQPRRGLADDYLPENPNHEPTKRRGYRRRVVMVGQRRRGARADR